MGQKELQLAADSGQQAALETRHYALSTRHSNDLGLRIAKKLGRQRIDDRGSERRRSWRLEAGEGNVGLQRM
jgi:hypothetical protein